MNTSNHEVLRIRAIGSYPMLKHLHDLLYREYETTTSTLLCSPEILPYPGEGTAHITIHRFNRSGRHRKP